MLMGTSMDNYEQLLEDVEALREYAGLDGCSLGELCDALCHTAQFPDYMSDKFLTQLHDEIKSQLTNFRTFATIVKTKETYTHTVVGLEWN